MTDTPITTEINCETGEVTTRPLTQAELDQRAVDAIAAAERQAEAEAEAKAVADAKASASAKLAKLGLTDSEISALVG
jgi:hypothetical protein